MASVDYNSKVAKYLKMYQVLSELKEQESNKTSLIEKPANIYAELQSSSWNELVYNHL